MQQYRYVATRTLRGLCNKRLCVTPIQRQIFGSNVITGWNDVSLVKRHAATAIIKDGVVREENREVRSIQDIVLPDFTASKNAYQSRTFLEVLRAYAVFRLCSIDTLVDHQNKILKALERVLGTRMFRGLMRRTLYGQFLAGENNDEVIRRARRERIHGILPMFAYTAAEIHGDVQSSISQEEMDELFEKNVEAIHNSIDIAAAAAENSSVRSKATSKMTFLTLPETLKDFNEAIRSNNKWLDELAQDEPAKLKDVLAEVSLRLKERPQDVLIQTTVPDLDSCKMNAAFHIELCAIRKQELARETLSRLTTLIKHINALGHHAASRGVRLVWDAEQTYLQDAIDCLVLDSMRRCNRQEPVVAGTYQCYLKRQLSSVKSQLDLAAKEGFCVGLKVVRGAYIVEEQRLAEENNYEDPINPSYDATSQMYYSVAEHILQNVVSGTVTTQTTFATHNLDTVVHIVNRMKELDLVLDGNVISFAQLVGMRDHITYPLGSVGVPASKLFHYGPVLEGVAYMSRRVQENRGGIGTANLERQMLGREVLRRISFRG